MEFKAVAIFLSCLFLSSSVDAICVPRNVSSISSSLSKASSKVAHQEVILTTPKATVPSTPMALDNVLTVAKPKTIATTTTTTLDVNPNVKRLCDMTDYHELCIESLGVSASQQLDPIKILKKEIEAAMNRTKNALVEVSKMLPKDGNPNSQNNMVLDTCKETYDSAMDEFNSSFEAIAAQDVGTLNSMLSAAVTMFGTCDDTYTEMFPDSESPLKGTSKTLMELVDNCLAIGQSIRI